RNEPAGDLLDDVRTVDARAWRMIHGVLPLSAVRRSQARPARGCSSGPLGDLVKGAGAELGLRPQPRAIRSTRQKFHARPEQCFAQAANSAMRAARTNSRPFAFGRDSR